MSLLAPLKRSWRDLRRGRPGRRFQDRYDHAAAENRRSSWIVRGLKIGAGVLCLVIGVAEMFFPGPAVVFFALGGALLATQSRTVARAMDWAECRVRATLRWVKRRWNRASGYARAGVVTLVAGVAAGGAVLTYRFLT